MRRVLLPWVGRGTATGRAGALPLAAPYLVGLGLLVALPLAAAVALAFTEFTAVEPPRYVGLANFRRLAGDGLFWQALGNTAVFVAVAVPLRLAAATAFALLLHRRGTGVAAARAAAYLPTVIPDVATGVLWLWLLNPFFGPLAATARSLGLASPSLLTDEWGARAAVAVMAGFQIGEAFIVALAWRRSVPAVLYEAAAVDGARPWYVARRVTLPLMAPVLGVLALRDVVLAFQLSFVPALLVTGGGPNRATTFLPLYVYDAAFRYFRLGYASAMSVAMLALTAVAVAVQWWVVRRWRRTAW